MEWRNQTLIEGKSHFIIIILCMNNGLVRGIVNQGWGVTWIPLFLVRCVTFKLLTRQRPGWIEWLERPGDWGELLGTQTISTRPCIACRGPKSLHLSRQIDWTPGLVCLALLDCWRGLEGSRECPLQRAQLMGTEQITCSGQTTKIRIPRFMTPC